MIDQWTILISGFRQSKSHITGMDILFQRVQESPGRIDYVAWDLDADEWAAFIHRHAAPDCRIIIAGYSWGGGRGALALSEALRKHGRYIDHMLLSDPVYRRRWVPTWFNLLPTSLTRGQTIKFPNTVRLIEWWHQTEDKPAGHRPTGAHEVRAGIRVRLPHSAMDESSEFHRAVIEAL